MKYELVDTYSETAVIKVIGVGGGGGNAVNHMVGCHIEGVEFICANTDAQALRKLTVDTIIQLGVELTKGLGAGTNPEIGKHAAEENKDRIKEVLQDGFYHGRYGRWNGYRSNSCYCANRKRNGYLNGRRSD